MSDFSSVALDSSGNVQTEKLQKELHAALEGDIKYKQVDSMKKRAIRVAKSYDEFKGMVACAHLKTLSSAEVQSLSAVKKGWKKGHTDNTYGSENSVLEKERAAREDQSRLDASCLIAGDESAGKKKGIIAPKTSMDYERDWRRLKTDQHRYNFLNAVGIKKTEKALRNDVSTELAEQMISFLVRLNPTAAPAPAPAGSSTERVIWDLPPPALVGETPAEGEEQAEEGDEAARVQHAKRDFIFSWLTALCQLSKFGMISLMLDDSVRSQAIDWLESCCIENAVWLVDKLKK